MKRIPLTHGKFALVDDGDYEDLSQFRWFADRGRNTFYAARNIRVGKKQIIERMHRRVLGLKFGDGRIADHKDENGLNNQRDNLRIATKAENGRNQKVRCDNTSGFRGVYWQRRDGKWQAQIKVDSREIYLGLFHSPMVAALAYNAAAIKYFGEFANLNRVN